MAAEGMTSFKKISKAARPPFFNWQEKKEEFVGYLASINMSTLVIFVQQATSMYRLWHVI